MSSLEVRWLLPIHAYPTRNADERHQGCPVSKQTRGCMAAGPRSVLIWPAASANPSDVKCQVMMGGEDLFFALLRFLFRLSRDSVEFLRTALSAVTRQGEDPFDGVGSSNYSAIARVVRMSKHKVINIDSIFFVIFVQWNLQSRSIKQVKGAILHDFPMIFPYFPQPTLPRTTPRLELWSSTATWIRWVKQMLKGWQMLTDLTELLPPGDWRCPQRCDALSYLMLLVWCPHQGRLKSWSKAPFSVWGDVSSMCQVAALGICRFQHSSNRFRTHLAFALFFLFRFGNRSRSGWISTGRLDITASYAESQRCWPLPYSIISPMKRRRFADLSWFPAPRKAVAEFSKIGYP